VYLHGTLFKRKRSKCKAKESNLSIPASTTKTYVVAQPHVVEETGLPVSKQIEGSEPTGDIADEAQLPGLMVMEEEEFFNVLEDPQGTSVEPMDDNVEEQFYTSNEYELEEAGEEQCFIEILCQNSDHVVNSDQVGSEKEACTTIKPSQTCGQDSKVDEPRATVTSEPHATATSFMFKKVTMEDFSDGNLTGSKRKQANSSNQIRQRTTTSAKKNAQVERYET
jgi:hypothetical protein